MNYYHELLNSYSRIKKRSFKIVSEAEAKSVAKTENDPGMEEAKSRAEAAAVVVKNNPSQYTKIDPYAPEEAPNLQIFATEKNGIVTSISYLLGNHISNLYKTVNGILTSTFNETKDLRDKRGGWGKFINQFVRESDEVQQDAQKLAAETPQAKRERLRVESSESINKSLSPFGLTLDEVGNLNNQEGTRQLPDELDFWGEGQDANRKRNAFLEQIETFLKRISEDDQLPPGEKGIATQNLFELLRVSTEIRRLSDDTIPPEVSNSLRSIYSKLATIESGELVLNNGADLSNKLSFGKASDGELGVSYQDIFNITEDIQERYNELLKNSKKNEELLIPDLETIELPNTGTPTLTKQSRADADELLWGGAGLLGSIVETFNTLESCPPAECAELRKDYKWKVGKLKEFQGKATDKVYLTEMANMFAKGSDRDLFPASPEQDFANNITDAVVSRLVSKKSFPTEQKARDFVASLGQDEIKAFATMLLLREESVREIFGSVAPAYTASKGASWGNIYRLKVDTAFIFNSDNKTITSLKKNIEGHLKAAGDAGNADRYFIRKTLNELIADKILKEEDIPPSQRKNLDQEVVMVALSAKLLASPDNDCNRGSAQGTSLAQVTGLGNIKGADGSPEAAWDIYSNYDPEDTRLSSELKTRIESIKEIEKYAPGAVDKASFSNLINFYESCKTNTNEGTIKKIWKSLGPLASSKLPLIVIDQFVQSMTAKTNQLNATNYVDGSPMHVQSDAQFRKKIIKGLSSGKFKIYRGSKTGIRQEGGRNKGQDLSSGLTQLFIYQEITDKNGKPVKRIPIVRLNLNDNRRTFGWVCREWAQAESEKNTPKREDASISLMHKFLTGQAKLLEELLSQ